MNEPSRGPRLVVKLGGSLAASPRLRDWLGVIAASPGTLLVPGGGPFADTVRAQQGVIGYDARAAHEMAMLAMAQFGRALAALAPCCALVTSTARMVQVCGGGGIGIAVPWPMLAAEAALPPSWQVTSDSIALWFARQFSAPLLLIKAANAPPGSSLAALAASGVIDQFFPGLAAGFGQPIHLAGPADPPPGGPLDRDRLPGRALDHGQFA